MKFRTSGDHNLRYNDDILYPDYIPTGSIRRDDPKSISGGIVGFDEHVIKSGSTNQITKAVNNDEAELCAIIKGTTQGIDTQSLIGDFGINLECSGLRLLIGNDSSTTKGIVTRQG